MKSDREFLNGIYQKAEVLKQQNIDVSKDIPNNKSKFQFVKQYKKIAIAAVVMLVAIPMIYYSTMPTMRVPSGFDNQTPKVARFAPYLDTQEVSDQSDLIVRAKVKRIERSVYENDNITTNVELTIKEIYKGQYQEKELTVCVNGGYNKKTKVYNEYEARFKRAEDTLLFLSKQDDKYILTASSQGKFTYLKTNEGDRVYQGPDGTIIQLSELQKMITH